MNDDERTAPTLEPRVAKLEVGLDRLTEDVRSLASIVREQGTQVEGEIQKLVVAVTQASGPRKTDWSVIISAVLLVMAIGSAVFWPLNQITQDNKIAIQEQRQLSDTHVTHNEIEVLEKRMNQVGDLKDKIMQQEIEYLERKVDLHNDRLVARVIRLEESNESEQIRQLKELDLWRQKAMGLSAPNAVVPLVPRESPSK